MLLNSNLFSWARAAASGLSPLLLLALMPGPSLAVTISGSAGCSMSGFPNVTPRPGNLWGVFGSNHHFDMLRRPYWQWFRRCHAAPGAFSFSEWLFHRTAHGLNTEAFVGFLPTAPRFSLGRFASKPVPNGRL